MSVPTSPIGGAWGPVEVDSTDEGLIVVRPVAAPPVPTHLGSAIDVAGATVVVDVTAGNAPPTAHIFDPFWSLTWLGAVYGDAVVEQVKALAREPELRAAEVLASYGALSDVFVRLGIATWLHRWWPSGNPDLNMAFSIELLELEIGALRWQAEAAFIERSPIDRVLRPHVGTVTNVYDWNRHEHRGIGVAVVEDVLVSALRGIVDVVPDSVAGYQDCVALLTAIDEGLQPDLETWDRFAELLALHPDTAGALRGKGLAPGERPPDGWTAGPETWTTADIRDLPPRFLRDVEANVSWATRTAGDRTQVTVTALAAPVLGEPVERGTLMARAYVDGVPIVFALAWEPRPQGAVFHGAADLPEGTDPGSAAIEVGVFHPAWAGGARLGGAALEQAERERAEITRVLTERYARLDERLATVEVRPDPAERPTAAEVVARFLEAQS